MTEHLVGVNGIVQIDPNEVLGIVRDEGAVTGASVLLWPGRWRIALRESVGGGGSGGPVAWADITGKPTSFPPASHRHDASEIDNLPTGSGGSTAWADITGKPAVIAAGADAAAARTAIGAGTSNLAIGTTGTTAAAGNRQATATAIGMVELATTAEATAGTDTQRAVTPAGLKAVADTKAASSHTHDDRYYTEAESDARYVRTVNGTGPDANGDVAVAVGEAPALGSFDALFIPVGGTFTPSNSARWASTYNPESVQCALISVTSHSSAAHNSSYKYKLVVYKAGPTAAELVFESPVLTGVAGEGIHSFTTGSVVFPRGVLFVQLIALSGSGGLFKSGMPDKFGAPRRDVNNEGAIDMVGLGTIDESWTAPATLGYGSRWEGGNIPHISMNGMVPA